MASEGRTHTTSALAACPNLDETNWVEWIRRIDDVLVAKSYLYRKILDNKLQRLTQQQGELPTVFVARFEKWEELQVQGRSIVRSKLSPEALNFSKDKGSRLFGDDLEDDLKTLIDELREKFRPQGVATFHRLQTSLLNLRLDQFNNTTEYHNEFLRLDDELKLLSEAAALPAAWMVGMYLNQLPSSFDTLKTLWIAQNDYVDPLKSKTALLDLMAKVRKEEQNMESTSERGLLSYNSGSNQNTQGKPVPKCKACGKPYHDDTQCIVKHPELKAALEKRLEKKRKDREAKRNKQKAGSSTKLAINICPKGTAS